MLVSSYTKYMNRYHDEIVIRSRYFALSSIKLFVLKELYQVASRKFTIIVVIIAFRRRGRSLRAHTKGESSVRTLIVVVGYEDDVQIKR